MGVPIVVFVLCLAGGAIAGSRWLPDLDVGPVGGLAFFGVCGLLGLALALTGEHLYILVHELKHVPVGLSKGEVTAGVLHNLATDDGTVLGLALAVYLLAPRIARTHELDEDQHPSS